MRNEFHTIDYYDGLCKAERIMEEKNIDCLPVLKQGKIIGILTSRDIRKSHPNRIVADAMNKKIVSVSSNTSLWKAKQELESHNIKRLLVVDDGQLVGLVTQAELLFELGKYIDLLTGLYRSDYIYHQSVELLAGGAEISIIFIDLDKFGIIDKEYGHAQGDIILREIGLLLKSHIPSEAFVCRFGGDEFIVLTPCKFEFCKALAEELIKAINTHVFSNNLTISASAGIACGARRDTKICALRDEVANLINLASLASTKAKKERQSIGIAEDYCSCEESA